MGIAVGSLLSRALAPVWYPLIRAAPKGRVFAPVWSENGNRLCPFWYGIGYGFNEETSYKEREKYRLRFRFCSCSNPSNDIIISKPPCMKTGVKTMTVLVWNRVRDLEKQEAPPPPPSLSLPSAKNSKEYSSALLN